MLGVGRLKNSRHADTVPGSNSSARTAGGRPRGYLYDTDNAGLPAHMHVYVVGRRRPRKALPDASRGRPAAPADSRPSSAPRLLSSLPGALLRAGAVPLAASRSPPAIGYQCSASHLYISPTTRCRLSAPPFLDASPQTLPPPPSCKFHPSQSTSSYSSKKFSVPMPPSALSSSPREPSVLTANGRTVPLSGVQSANAREDSSYLGYDHVHWFAPPMPMAYPMQPLIAWQVGRQRQAGRSVLQQPLRLPAASLPRARDAVARDRLTRSL